MIYHTSNSWQTCICLYIQIGFIGSTSDCLSIYTTGQAETFIAPLQQNNSGQMLSQSQLIPLNTKRIYMKD